MSRTQAATRLIAATVLIGGAVTLTAAPATADDARGTGTSASPAQRSASPGPVDYDCDGGFPFVLTGESGRFDHKGRTVTLETEREPDWHAVTRVKNPERSDRIWIDRSMKTFEMTDEVWHPSDATVNSAEGGGGYKRCVQEASWLDALAGWTATDMVHLQTSTTRSYAVRPCIQAAGSDESECGDWYVDHID